MIIKKQHVQPVKVTWHCECGGQMQANGFTKQSNPPHYGHTCDKCGRSEYIRGKTFPMIEFEPMVTLTKN